MKTYKITVAGEGLDAPTSHYQVTAEDETTAMLMASLVDQHTSHRPLYPESPITLEQIAETEIAKSYCKVK